MLNSLPRFQNFRFQPPAPPAGSVIVSDDFRGRAPGTQTPHGAHVANTIVEMGFPGPVIADQHDMVKSHAENFFEGALATQVHSKENAVNLLHNLAEAKAVSVLDSHSGELLEGLQFGEHNSVRNFSSGVSKSNITMGILDSALAAYESQDPRQQEMGRNVLGNLAAAYDVDFASISSEDLKTRRAAKTKLAQGLVHTVSDSLDNSPIVQQSQNDFTELVRAYESNNNSVVVAAGNDGDIAEGLLEIGLQLPADFTQSLLAIDEVTTVGALQGKGIADYSNRDAQIDIFADGNAARNPFTGEGAEGTSFAAPRVSALMASIHATNPNATSEEVEQILRAEFAKEVNNAEDGSFLALNRPRHQAPPQAAFGGAQSTPPVAPLSLGQALMGMIRQLHQALFPSAPVQLAQQSFPPVSAPRFGSGFHQPQVNFSGAVGSTIDFYAG